METTPTPAISLNCLICQRKCESSVSKSSDFKINSTDCPSLCSQVGVIFTVCNLLDLPEDRVIQLLSNHGNPDQWGLAYCPTCAELIEKAQEVYVKIRNLQLNFQFLKKKVEDEVRISLQQKIEKSFEEDQQNVSDYIRQGLYLKINASKNSQEPQVEELLYEARTYNTRRLRSKVSKFPELKSSSSNISGFGRFHKRSKVEENDIESNDVSRIFSSTSLCKTETTTIAILDPTVTETLEAVCDGEVEIKIEIDDKDIAGFEPEGIVFQEFEDYYEDSNYSPGIKSDIDEDESYHEDSDTESDQSEKRNFKIKCIKIKPNLDSEESINKRLVKRGRGRPRKNPPREKKQKKPKREPRPPKIRPPVIDWKKMVECTLCNKSIQYGSMGYHMKTHAAEPQYQCRGCHKRFNRKDYWELHEDTHIYNVHKMFNCAFCETKVTRKAKYINHVHQLHEDEISSNGQDDLNSDRTVHMAFFCDAKDCNECYIKREDFLDHLKEHWKDDEPLQCTVCQKYFAGESSKKKHEELHANLNTIYNCDYCPFAFEKHSDLEAHLVFHRIEYKTFHDNLCQECGQSFETIKRLKNHIYIAHTKKRKKLKLLKERKQTGSGSANKGQRRGRRPFNPLVDYKCKICGMDFKHQNALIQHCSSEKHGSFQCNQCEKQYITPKALYDHSFEHISETYPCKQCSKVYRKPVNLYHHVRLRHQERKAKHLCSYCPKRYVSKFQLNRHIVQNHREIVDPGIILHYCIVCYTSFDSEKSVNIHMKESHPDRKCHFCGKYFFDATKLNDHLLTHTGERPHSCKVCSKSFARINSLKEHERIHTGERPFHCLTCGKDFLTKRLLKNHILKHHPEIPYDPNVVFKSENVSLENHGQNKVETINENELDSLLNCTELVETCFTNIHELTSS